MADSNRSIRISTQIMDAEGIASSIQGKLDQYLPPPISQWSIFKVPNILRRDNEKVFTPEVVSIGPFHRNKTQLQEMENNKLWYLKCLLNRTRTTELKSLVEAIERIEQEYCRKCYSEVVDLTRDEFIEMMVIDGCFILEFLYRYQQQEGREDDPVFKMPWMPRKIIADLLLLENQLPWCVLVCLFNLTNSITTVDLVDLVDIPFSTEYMIFDYIEHKNRLGNRLGTHKHLLDCFRNCLVGSCTIKRPESPPASSLQPMWIQILSVKQFLDFGVGFSVQFERRGFLNVMFEDGKMKMAPIFIEENTESLFKNLIAFEHCDPSTGYEITSYAALFSCLIKSPADALHLKQKRIHIGLSNDDDTASFLNRLLHKDARFNDYLYSDLSERVWEFCTSRRRYWRAILRRDYIREPSAFITFLTGVVLSLILSSIQTVFAILSYNPSKSAT